MNLDISNISLASSYVASRTKTISDKLDLISVIFSLWMCYFAWVNIYEYQYKHNDYRIYHQHYLVRVQNIDQRQLFQQCQFIPQLDLEALKIINCEDEKMEFLGISVTYSTTIKMTSILIVILNFLTFFLGTYNPIWSLRLFGLLYFFDLAYTVQAPLINNVNYGEKCLEKSPLLNFISPKFLPESAGNMLVMVMIVVTFIIIITILNVLQKGLKSYPCQKCKLKNLLYVLLFLINLIFLVYCLFYYVTSFWTNTLLCNFIWFLNTIMNYISYCNTVEDLKDGQVAHKSPIDEDIEKQSIFYGYQQF